MRTTRGRRAGHPPAGRSEFVVRPSCLPQITVRYLELRVCAGFQGIPYLPPPFLNSALRSGSLTHGGKPVLAGIHPRSFPMKFLYICWIQEPNHYLLWIRPPPPTPALPSSRSPHDIQSLPFPFTFGNILDLFYGPNFKTKTSSACPTPKFSNILHTG